MSNKQRLTLKVPWKIVFKIWWAFLWRFMIIGAAIYLILIFISNILLIFTGMQLSAIENKFLDFLVGSVGEMIACILVFRLVLFKKYKGFSLHIVHHGNKWKVCQTFGWSFYWRLFIFGAILGAILGGISGGITYLAGATDLMPIISGTYGVLARIIVSLFLLKFMLQKRFSDFSITISKSI